MAGIVSYGAYIPLWRMGKETAGWNSSVEKAVGSFDEDAITMAVAASIDCLQDIKRNEIDEFLFATTSSPFEVKQAASLIATACSLPRNALTGDIAASTRGGTIALKLGLDAVKAGSARRVLTTSSEFRAPQARSDAELNYGDGAAAFILGNEDVIAEVEDFGTISDEIFDIWKLRGEKYERTWEDRFNLDEGYLRLLTEAVNSLLAKNKTQTSDIATAVYYAPNLRQHADMGKRLKLDPAQIEKAAFNAAGNTGTASVPMMLVSALERAKPGDRILVANYGNGADALLLRVTDKINSLPERRGIKKYSASKQYLKSYETYLQWKGLLDAAPIARRPPQRGPSAAAVWREKNKNLKLQGFRCRTCGYPQYPPEKVCANCGTRENMEPYDFADKKGQVFTFTKDYLAPTLAPPLVVCIVNIDGGGRLMLAMTDVIESEVNVGMPVEMSFRLLFVADGTPSYFWKCMPVR